MPLTVAQIAAHVGGEVIGDGSVEITGLAEAKAAKAGDLTFAETAEYLAAAEQSNASAILVEGGCQSARKTLIRVPKARIAFAKILALLYPEPEFTPGVHPTALVASSAQVHPSAYIGPYCVVEERVIIGPKVVLAGGNHIGSDSRIGGETRIFPRVVIYPRTQIGSRVRIHAGAVIGSDGFGYVFENGQHLKVPQVGWVVIGDDVEIGANVTVDRGALGPTIIGKGTKIDNLVQVAHNVKIGEHCILVSQCGVAGSTTLGDYVTLAGQVGIAGHLKIGSKVVVEAQSGVMHDIPDGQVWLGSPAQPNRQTKRQWVALMQLPDLLRRVREIEKKLGLQD